MLIHEQTHTHTHSAVALGSEQRPLQSEPALVDVPSVSGILGFRRPVFNVTEMLWGFWERVRDGALDRVRGLSFSGSLWLKNAKSLNVRRQNAEKEKKKDANRLLKTWSFLQLVVLNVEKKSHKHWPLLNALNSAEEEPYFRLWWHSFDLASRKCSVMTDPSLV